MSRIVRAVSLGLDAEQYPVTKEWAVRLESPENGIVSLFAGDGHILSAIPVSIRDTDEPAGIILADPKGNESDIHI